MSRSQYLFLPKQNGIQEVYQFSAGGKQPPALLTTNRIVGGYCTCAEGDKFCIHLQMSFQELEGGDIPEEKICKVLDHYKKTMDTVVLAIGRTKKENAGRVDLLIECDIRGVELWGYYGTVLVHMYFTDSENFDKDYRRLS